MAEAVVPSTSEECTVKKDGVKDNCSKCKCDYSCIGNIFFRKRKKRKEEIKKQAYPYGLSKYVVMCLGCLSICLTSSLYYNWTIFEDLFMRQGALAGLCTEEERKAAKPNTFICDAQRRQISNLYSAIMYTDSFVGSIGGYIGDRFGAYCALLIGQVFGIIAFVMFYLFTQSTIMLYVTFMFWGVSASFALAPTWHYSRMFTFGNNMAVSVITSADNMSMYTPTFFQMIANRYNIGFTGASLTYVFWGILVCIAVTLFFIPKRFIVMDEEEEESDENYELSAMFNEGMMKAVKSARYWLSVTCYVLLCSVRLFYRRSFTLLFFDNEEVTEFLEVSSDFSFAGSFVLGYMNEFFGVVPMMGVTTLMYIAALIAVYFRNFPCAYTSALLFAIAQAGDIQQLITFIDEYFPEHESTLMGLANIVNTIFGLLLQYTFNHVFDWLGPRITVFVMILILGGVLVICYIIELGMSHDNDEEEEEEDKKEENQKESIAEKEEMDYNPLGPKILLYNIFGAFLSFPYFASLCTAVAINNMNQEDKIEESELEDRVVRKLEKDQFYVSMDRVVELCSAVFYTSLIVLLGCIFEFSRRTELMQTHNCILLLMSILIGCAGGTSLLLPYTQIFSVMPPIVTVALTVVPPLSLVVFGWVDRRDAFSFTIMCTLVGVYGFVLFMAGNIMLYMNALMGARFGKPAHSLMGWSNLGMGYFYTLLIIYTIRELYTGDCNIGGYIIVMGMQCAISVFATLVLYLHLSHEQQYFYVKCKNDAENSEKCPTEESGNCKHDDGSATHVDYFVKNNDGGCNHRLLKFRSQYSQEFEKIRNPDYGLLKMEYSTKGILKPDHHLLFLAISVLISLSDASMAFLAPGLFVHMTLMTVSAYFTVRLLFAFLDDEIEKAVKDAATYLGYIWGALLSICIALFVLNAYQLKWLTVEEIPKSTYIIFCVSYCARMWLNAIVQHHIISRLEQFKMVKWESKSEHAHNTVMYMNLGHCGGLGVLTYLCYRYFT
ncbi:Monocarboxylate transporter 1 [Babesia bigemina]|uniref:Monocarboxylate transporter 1 n=1 Tax=Babesia bigemina TaxID=5866 RepID=A0A061D9P1_BABBI|nr:Monocarboxylate transporter 1 [Babesia bigemina]CDR95639.1 Monocarboxylate transporter 1 [Babesia bigemina]|eukprot:XP_012767825.1 Monocarboxylate transporter 1 [Babesia bigemina]